MANRKGIDHDLLARPGVPDPWGVPSAVADLYDDDDVTEDLPMIPVDLVRMSTARYVGSYTPFGRVRTWLAIVLARLSWWVAP